MSFVPLFAILSCETMEELNTDPGPKPLSLVGILIGGETEHEIYAGQCFGTDVSGLPAGVRAELMINGKEQSLNVISAPSGPDTLRFEAPLAPGDVVSVRLFGEEYDVSADTQIPEPCRIERIDTLTVYSPDIYQRTMNLTLTIDPGNNTWFRTFDADMDVQHYEGTTGEVKAGGTRKGAGMLNMDTNLFRKNAVELPDEFAGQLGLPDNGYNNAWKLFSLGSDASAAFQLNWTIGFHSVVSAVRYQRQTHYDLCMARMIVRSTVWSVERETWLYLNSLSLMNSFSGDPFTEPAVLYGNVRGGVGCLGAAYQSTVNISLSDILLYRDIYMGEE